MLAFSERERLFRRSRKVLVAVSGGADSLACLLILRELREQLNFELAAGHFNHLTRPESTADLARVREICAQLGVDCLTGEGDVAAVAREQRRSVEEVARAMRYQFLAFVAGKEGADRIATGHTADDQVETVLMRVLRGSGVRGIRGMLPAADVPGGGAQRLIRPLLELTRAETGAICAAAGIEPVVDASNADLRFARNRLRHETIPALRAVNPSLDRALIGLAASAREAFEPIERQAMLAQPRERIAVGAIFELRALRELPAEGLTLVIEREASFYKREPEVNRTRLENLRSVLSKGAGEVPFGPVVVEVSTGLARVGPLTEPPPSWEPVVLNVPGVTRAGDVIVTVTMDATETPPGAWAGALDMARLKGALRIRPLRPGDRIVTPGGRRSLQDFFVNTKTPRWTRREALALADGETVHALAFGPALPGPQPPDDTALYVQVAVPRPPDAEAVAARIVTP